MMIRADFDDIRFQCQRCGSCCHHRRPQEFDGLIPGSRMKEFWEKSNLIYMTKKDIDKISRRSRMEPEDFVDTLYEYDGCCVKVEDSGRKVILDLPVMRSREDALCVFYNNGCRIYPVRPNACRLFPFRVEEETMPSGDMLLNIRYNPSCPGIGKGSSVNKERLKELVADQFMQRAESVATEIQRLQVKGAISREAQVYRTMPGRKCLARSVEP
ncbi:MAG: YkgJ family cysteine cluster protein [Methanotrichaceae archaeon]